MTQTFKAFNFNNSLLVMNLTILAALALFGTNFSKLIIAPGIYLHDALLITGASVSLCIYFKRANHLPTLIVLFVSLIYLIISIRFRSTPVELIVRQYALFAYLACYYFLNLYNLTDCSALLIKKFLVYLGIFSVLSQAGTVLYYIYNGEFDPFNYKNHIWYSHASSIGLIVAAVTTLVYLKNVFLKIALIILILLLAWTTGHASAQLAIISILFIHAILQFKKWKKLLPVILGLFITLLLVEKAPQFSDSNSDWRLLIWKYHLSNLIINNHMMFGNGFGVPYMDSNLERYLYEQISSTVLQEIGKPDERYLSPPHNSFMTILFAIGVIPGFIILQPLFRIPGLILGNRKLSEFGIVILLSLIGLIVWCSFNVVLEVPHTAGFFWLLYFTFVKLKQPHN